MSRKNQKVLNLILLATRASSRVFITHWGFSKQAAVTFCLCLPMFSMAYLVANAADQNGCKDHPLFNRMPGYYIDACDYVDFDMRKFPVGPPLEDKKLKHEEIEGNFIYLSYHLGEGGKKASGLQIMRNFQNAAKAGGCTIEGEYPDWCKASAEYDNRLGNSCTNWGTTIKCEKSGKEVWIYVQLRDEERYGMQIVERGVMKQEIEVRHMNDNSPEKPSK